MTLADCVAYVRSWLNCTAAGMQCTSCVMPPPVARGHYSRLIPHRYPTTLHVTRPSLRSSSSELRALFADNVTIFCGNCNNKLILLVCCTCIQEFHVRKPIINLWIHFCVRVCEFTKYLEITVKLQLEFIRRHTSISMCKIQKCDSNNRRLQVSSLFKRLFFTKIIVISYSRYCFSQLQLCAILSYWL